VNITPINRSEEQLEAASRWVLKIDEGALSASDQAALNAWLGEHITHREMLLEVAAVWDKAGTLARLSDLFPHESTSDRVQRTLWSWPSALVAVCLAVLVINGALLLKTIGYQPAANTTARYETEIGGQKTVLLPDGSQVVLNTNSLLAVTYTPSARVLSLVRGEILVRVAEDRDRPLSVVTKDRIIQAVGTEFLVEITADDRVIIVVTEGRVVIGVHPQAVRSPGPIDEDVDALDIVIVPPVISQRGDNTVVAGEQIILSPVAPVKRAITADAVEVKLSWQEGRLIFNSEPLEQVLQEIERYTTVKFILMDENLKSKTLTGRFRTGDVEALLASLRLNFQITHEFDGEDRVLLSNLVTR
jgi:transmembrane sensor